MTLKLAQSWGVGGGRWDWVEQGVGWENGKDMEGVWSVQQITLYWTFTTSANIYHLTCFHLLLFWHSEVHNRISYKLLTNFELTNFNQLPPSFSVLLFAMCDFGLTKTFFATVGTWCKRVFFLLLFLSWGWMLFLTK